MKIIVVFLLITFACIAKGKGRRTDDANLCPMNGWIHLISSCYYFSKTKTTMSNARSSCRNMGGDLVLPINNEEHKAIWQVAKEKKLRRPWIGLKEQQKNIFYTLDGKIPSYTNWGSSQPDNKANEPCVVFYEKDEKWHDISCSYHFNYICQKNLRTYKLSCGENRMKISILKSHFNVTSASQLQLLDSSCKPQETKYDYVFTTSLTACGTTMTTENDGKTVSFHNKIVESLSAFNNTISRFREIQFPFKCNYPRSYLVSSSSFGLADFTITPNNGSSNDNHNISLIMGLYDDQSFSQPLIGDPSLNGRLYVEIGLNTTSSSSRNSSFGIKLNECYVTSKSSLAEYKYLLIERGCKKDKTVSFHKSLQHQKRFSFLVFRFRGLHHYRTHVHCRVSVCEIHNKSCHLGCRSSQNGKRMFSDDQRIRYFF
ncbi:ZP domain-containing protein-like [Dendronephthya gigantea]|uniref:ZP domain-containing protein-like n=1 Tax=Dendronephthya gigantea TaxID=151771 RepID=UPI00106C666F|nr:ZP domain-containing protein-like [Dendronephthya gigantea]